MCRKDGRVQFRCENGCVYVLFCASAKTMSALKTAAHLRWPAHAQKTGPCTFTFTKWGRSCPDLRMRTTEKTFRKSRRVKGGGSNCGLGQSRHARGVSRRFPPQRGSRHGAAPASARAVPAARALLRPILPALPAPRCPVFENPPEQSSGLWHRGGIRPGEGPSGAEGVGVPQRGGAQPALGAAGAAGPGGVGGLRLRPQLPLQRLGGVALPPPADPRPPLPHPALRGPHGPRAGARGRFWGVFGAFGVSPDAAELRHRPAGPQPAHHHPQQADPDHRQRPAGSHGAALGAHHGAPVRGRPGPDLHLPDGNRGSPFGLDLRGLGHLQRGPAGPGAAPGGLPGPPPQKGVTPGNPAPQETPKSERFPPKLPTKKKIATNPPPKSQKFTPKNPRNFSQKSPRIPTKKIAPKIPKIP